LRRKAHQLQQLTKPKTAENEPEVVKSVGLVKGVYIFVVGIILL